MLYIILLFLAKNRYQLPGARRSLSSMGLLYFLIAEYKARTTAATRNTIFDLIVHFT